VAGFMFRLETRDGEPAQPSTLSAAVPDWRIGSRICLGASHAAGCRPTRRGRRPTAGAGGPPSRWAWGTFLRSGAPVTSASSPMR
jgi:hypothetical protein